MVPFHLITGFLGSGKTTFLAHILKEIAPVNKVVVIQNEFAPSGIDGKELKRQVPGFKLIEINNGSVFCVCQLSNFIETVKKLLRQYEPDQIFLEASGLADPISIVELLLMDELKSKVSLGQIICLVDALNFFKGVKGLVRFKHQLMIADNVILNKSDLTDAQNLKAIRAEIIKLNPYACITPTVYAHIPWSKCITHNGQNGLAANQFRGKESAGRPQINSCVLRTHDILKEENLKAFIQSLQSTCLRIKGFFNLADGRVASVHSVFEQLHITIIREYAGPSEMIAFGEDLTLSDLRKRFKLFTC
ncbi:GTP-binding protein [Carboxylicivirga sediminis]|uniref:GTP-binding protein n=1 Tax=Carboxylicivirga sediminis TaxID=2006564 RepID=A0A941F6M2_9BACT|nr:GTP-binding protein [Carboxylicivirga sediminis]MBR8536680.1 GTP-binding protein [Carboxylicivirga sediminis]